MPPRRRASLILAVHTSLLVIAVTVAACHPPGRQAAVTPAMPSAAPFDLETEPDDETEFEIDADATRYVGRAPMTVEFQAVALNGAEPTTFAWTFDDGSEPATATHVTRTFTEVGQVGAVVTGVDATGAESRVILILRVLPAAEEPDAAPAPPPEPSHSVRP